MKPWRQIQIQSWRQLQAACWHPEVNVMMFNSGEFGQFQIKIGDLQLKPILWLFLCINCCHF
jgi:hypothetical protein